MASSALDFGVLGTLSVRKAGNPISVSSPRQRAVLTALLVHAGRPVSGDALIEAAWPRTLPVTPRAALHTLLSRLRAVLGVETIQSEPGGFRLMVDASAVDAGRFEALRARASVAAAAESLRLLDTALGLWRGPAYSEFADRDFASAEAVRLDELRLVCREDVAELRLELGDSGSAVATLESFVTEHPLRERARGLLMSALYREGRASDALDRYRHYRGLLSAELGLDPSPVLRDLQQRILDHRLSPAAAPRTVAKAPATPWPTSATTFLGRDDEMAELLELAARHRLVTVAGPGGVGKTRLVAEVLPALAEWSRLPTTVVELAGVKPEAVEVALASALGIGPGRGDATEATLEFLSVTPTLLVLDNCEHVLPRLHPLVRAALRRCPGLRIIATSRRRFGLPGEQVLPVEPLPTPALGAEPASAELNAAMRLFADRARRMRPSFALTNDNVPAVAEICRRLDGLPLAIELAATRAATLGVDPLRQRLHRSLDLLGGDGEPVERSLRAALDWSYELLGRSERMLFSALAVFEGDFDLDVVEQVAVGIAVSTEQVAVGLSELVDASLVVTRRDSGKVRYRLLEIVRAYARERLAETGAEARVRLAHARWVRSHVRAAARAATGPDDGTAWSRLNTETASIRSAVDWALRTGETTLAGDVTAALVLASMHWQLRLELIELVRTVAGEPAIAGSAAASQVTAAGAFAAIWQGDLESGERMARDALTSAAAAADRFLALCSLGIVTLYRGDLDASRRCWGELLTIDGLPPAHRVDGHASLALVACYQGEVAEARRHVALASAAAEAAEAGAYLSFVRYVEAEVTAAEDLTAAVPLLTAAAHDADRLGAEFAGGLAATALVAALTRTGRGDEAVGVVAELLDRWLRLAAWPQLWTTLRISAELLAEHDRPEVAALVLAAAEQAPSAPALTGDDDERYTRLARMSRERVGPSAHQKITALGAILPRAQVVDRVRAAVRDLDLAAGRL